MKLEIRVRPVGGNRLVDDYVRGDASLAPFFAGHPYDAAAYHRKADSVRRRFEAEALSAMADAVRPTGPGAAEKLESIAAGDGFFVTTGQQPGLFGGPLYTVYKALTASALAERLEALLGSPVLPLFWVASDDHDWAEANHIRLLDTDNTLRTLTLQGASEPALSMGRRPLDGAAETALDELAQLLPPSEFTPPLMERLRAEYDGDSVADAFTRTMERILDGVAMAFVDPQAEAVRRLGRTVLRRDLENMDTSAAALRRQTERLEAAGYSVQVPILPDATNVFYEEPDDGQPADAGRPGPGRERILRGGDGWVLRASRRTLSDDELWALFEESPERFSANVVLRPVLESAVFPTLAYVGGPGEVRYLAQTGCLFEVHGIGMPMVFPRLGVTLVESKVRKVLDKFGLEEGDLVGRPIHEVIAGVVRDDVPDAVQSALSELRQSVQEGYQAIYDAAEEIDPTLKGPIFGARNDGFRALSEVEKKIRHHVKMRQETDLEQIEKAAANLAPDGKPQERVLNVHQYLARYGEDLIPAIRERMEVDLDAEGENWTGVHCD